MHVFGPITPANDRGSFPFSQDKPQCRSQVKLLQMTVCWKSWNKPKKFLTNTGPKKAPQSKLSIKSFAVKVLARVATKIMAPALCQHKIPCVTTTRGHWQRLSYKEEEISALLYKSNYGNLSITTNVFWIRNFLAWQHLHKLRRAKAKIIRMEIEIRSPKNSSRLAISRAIISLNYKTDKTAITFYIWALSFIRGLGEM